MHILQEQRRIAEAAIAMEDFRAKWPDADPHDEDLARLFARMGLVEEAIDLDPSLRPFLLAESGQRDLALAAMEEEARNRTDPHDRADAYWITYLRLDMKDEALEVLSDLWYGYAAEDMGPRMDFTDVFTFVQLLRAAGRHEEAEPIARMFVESEGSGSDEPNPSVLMTAGDNDAAMARFLDLAERGRFPAWSSRLRSTIFALESHPDYPRLEAMFEAWQEEQRVLYDELTAARASPDDVAHP
jgi:hypothetical protein